MEKNICSEHQGMAISCSKIEEIHETLKRVDGKIDSFDHKLDDYNQQTHILDNRLSVLETQKSERWRVQKWWNITFITALLGVGITLGIEWAKFHGGK